MSMRLFGFLATLPLRFYKQKISQPEIVKHEHWVDYLSENFNKPGFRVLEIGSREVVRSSLRNYFDQAHYVGFDFHPGDNVDLVGDVHKLSKYIGEDEKFDLIFSTAVFEHLHMPWVAASEMSKVLKVGGFIFVETHFSFNSHERPWHFFQFSDNALKSLFNRRMGFEVIDSGMSNPMIAYFSKKAAKYLSYLPIVEMYCHSEIYVRKIQDVEELSWDDVGIDDILEGTEYPLKTSLIKNIVDESKLP